MSLAVKHLEFSKEWNGFHFLLDKFKLSFLLILFNSSTIILAQTHSHLVGNKNFELTNHLGNILEVTTDRKVAQHTEAEIVTFNDYYPYGMLMEERNGTLSGAEEYRYAFQGQEKDDGIKGMGNSYNYTYRMHDSRLGRFFAVDPISKEYSYNSTYAFSENEVTDAVELEGLEKYKLQGKWTIEKRKQDGSLILRGPQTLEEFNSKFEVEDENGVKLQHFKYQDFETKMKAAEIRFSKGGLVLGVQINAPNVYDNYKPWEGTENWHARIIEGSLKTSVELDFFVEGIHKPKKETELKYTAPNTDGMVNYELSFEHYGGHLPNKFMVLDMEGNEISTGGSLEVDQENTTGSLSFSIQGGSDFKIKVIGKNVVGEDNDQFKISGKIKYTQTYNEPTETENQEE